MSKPKLVVSLLIDAVGLASYAIPVWGEASDIVFFAVEGAWIWFAYKNGPLAALGGAEELIPFTDVLPMCTIAHIYTERQLKKARTKKQHTGAKKKK